METPDIQEIIKKNPAVDEKRLREHRKLMKQLRAAGFHGGRSNGPLPTIQRKAIPGASGAAHKIVRVRGSR